MLSTFLMGRYKTISDLMINEQIRDKEIRLIGEDGAQLGDHACEGGYENG